MESISVKTRKHSELVDITHQVEAIVTRSGIKDGLCLLYVPHTTAAVTINESADPTVRADIAMMLEKVIPWEAGYRHLECNSAAHIKSTLVGASEIIMIADGNLVLGTWQGVFFCEFDGPRNRKLYVRLIP